MNSTPSPIVSLLIAIYKVEAYIAECLRSVLSQNYPCLEIILVDDCSPDRSMEIAEHIIATENRHNHSVRIVRHEQNQGLSLARISGVNIAQGEYLLFLDSDDYWVHDHVVTTVVHAMREQQADMLTFGVMELRKKGMRSLSIPYITSPFEQTLAYLEGNLPAYLWNKCFRKELFLEKANLWKKGISLWEDLLNVSAYSLWVKNIGYIPEPLHVYRRTNEHSITTCISPQEQASVKEVTAILHEYFGAQELPPHKQQKISDALTTLKARALLICLKTDEYSRFLQIAQGASLTPLIYRKQGAAAFMDRLVLTLLSKHHWHLAFLLFRLKQKLISFVR